MKEKIHPVYQSVKIMCSCGNQMTIRSTLSSDTNVEICFRCHDLYSDEKRELRAGPVERFNKRYQNLLPKKSSKTPKQKGTT